MFKRIIAVLLVITTFLSFSGFSSKKKQEIDLSTPEAQIANSVLQYPATNEDFRYDVYTYYVAVTECLSSKSNIIIPDTIQNLPVYKIGNKAFSNQTSITSVTMTNNIIEIGDSAFEKCTNLESIILSKNLQVCGSSAFSKCENLKAVTIPSSLIIVPSNMFSKCDRLTAVIIENNDKIQVTAVGDKNGRSIQGNAFSYCPLLKNIWIPKEVTIIENSAFNFSTEKITFCGEAESAAAHFASENLLDFTVLSKSDFSNIMTNAIATESISVGSPVESALWKVTFDGVYSLRDKFTFETGEYIKTRELKNSNEVVVLCFSIKNLSASQQTFNFLDVKIKSDGYSRKTSTFGKIQCAQFNKHNQPLLGKIEAGGTLYGYVAVEVTGEWKDVSVQFVNDTALEEYAFTVKSTDKAVHYIGGSSEPITDVPKGQTEQSPMIEDTSEQQVEEETSSTDTPVEPITNNNPETNIIAD